MNAHRLLCMTGIISLSALIVAPLSSTSFASASASNQCDCDPADNSSEAIGLANVIDVNFMVSPGELAPQGGTFADAFNAIKGSAAFGEQFVPSGTVLVICFERDYPLSPVKIVFAKNANAEIDCDGGIAMSLSTTGNAVAEATGDGSGAYASGGEGSQGGDATAKVSGSDGHAVAVGGNSTDNGNHGGNATAEVSPGGSGSAEATGGNGATNGDGGNGSATAYGTGSSATATGGDGGNGGDGGLGTATAQDNEGEATANGVTGVRTEMAERAMRRRMEEAVRRQQMAGTEAIVTSAKAGKEEPETPLPTAAMVKLLQLAEMAGNLRRKSAGKEGRVTQPQVAVAAQLQMVAGAVRAPKVALVGQPTRKAAQAEALRRLEAPAEKPPTPKEPEALEARRRQTMAERRTVAKAAPLLPA